MSRAEKCVAFGVAMTVLARLGPWSWPGWPAITLLDFTLARYAPSVASPLEQALGTVVLLIVNAGFWAVIAWAVLTAVARIRRRREG